MAKEKKSNNLAPDPISAINEFEEESIFVLELAKKEASEIIEKARLKANGVIQKEREDFVRLEKEYLDRVEAEVMIEKKRLGLEIEDKLKKIQGVPSEKIKIASHNILERIIPKGI